MQYHHYTLQNLCTALSPSLVGQRVEACFSQSKNELILAFAPWTLRIGCHTPLSYLVPVSQFAKARKNVVDLFPGIVGLALEEIRVIAYERTLVLAFEQDVEMWVKLHGPGSNLILRQGGKTLSLFNKQLVSDWTQLPSAGPFDPDKLESPPDSGLEQVWAALKAVSPIYDRQFAQQVCALMEQGANIHTAWEQVEQYAREDRYFLARDPKKVRFLLFAPTGEEPVPVLEIKGVIPALQAFLRMHFQYSRYVQLYRAGSRFVEQEAKKYTKIYQSYLDNIEQLEANRNPEELGHILMGHLHMIPVGVKKVELEDWYQGGKVSIKIKPDLSPQENAERYYNKYKERKKRLKYLKGEMADIEEKYFRSMERKAAFEEIPAPDCLRWSAQGFDQDDLRPLREWSAGELKIQEAQKPAVPFKVYTFQGYDIFVGKNAKNNDQLSFKYAHKDDLWLHAKDVPGSHVIIRQKAGQNVPEPVLEYAAGLAAYFSKRKTDTLVPVAYTPRKYIRKRKGDPPGAVVVAKESVIMVPPYAG